MMNLEEYSAYDGLGLAGLVHNGEVTAYELAELAEEAVKQLNPKLNFLVSETPEHKTDALRNMDKNAPFAGLPFFMKEGHGVKGQSATMACRLGQGFISKADSEIVRRYRRAGVVILGCTNVPELGSAPTTESVMHGPTRNPWNLEHSAGGSSGGAAAAVAAGVVPVAHASDGGGSIRTPAHCCGVVGLKPTRGRTPVGPFTDGWPFGYFHQHVVSRTVRDTAAMLDATHGFEEGALFHAPSQDASFLVAAQTDPGRLRIAISSRSPSGSPVHPECIAAVEETAKLCEELGHEVTEAVPDFSWEECNAAFGESWYVPFPFWIKSIEDMTGRKAGPDTLELYSLAFLEQGLRLTPYEIANTAAVLNRVRHQVAPFFQKYDVFLTPVATRPAVKLGELAADGDKLSGAQWGDRYLDYVPFPMLYNVTGQPAISLPIHESVEGLPIGLQFAARLGDDAKLLSLAGQLERARPWIARRPRFHVSRL
jgi:amidase